jgi:hypothetical protein
LGLDNPFVFSGIPVHLLGLLPEYRSASQVPSVCDPVCLSSQLGAVGLFMLRHISGLLQQRHVDVALYIAHKPWVAVPVPHSPIASSRINND